jgi:hypothetical protein
LFFDFLGVLGGLVVVLDSLGVLAVQYCCFLISLACLAVQLLFFILSASWWFNLVSEFPGG